MHLGFIQLNSPIKKYFFKDVLPHTLHTLVGKGDSLKNRISGGSGGFFIVFLIIVF